MHCFSRHRKPAVLAFYQLHRAHRNATVEQMNRRHLQDVGNPILLTILAYSLDQGDDAAIPSQKKLAELLHVSPATVANSLKSLERGGYVRKEPAPDDARCNRVLITEKGNQAVEGCMEVFDSVDAQLVQGFTPEELALAQKFIHRMLDNLYQIGGNHNQCPAYCSDSPPYSPHERTDSVICSND